MFLLNFVLGREPSPRRGGRARRPPAGQIRHPGPAKTASARMLPDGGGDDEERWLAEGIAGVQQNAFYMHRALVSPLLRPRTLASCLNWPVRLSGTS